MRRLLGSTLIGVSAGSLLAFALIASRTPQSSILAPRPPSINVSDVISGSAEPFPSAISTTLEGAGGLTLRSMLVEDPSNTTFSCPEDVWVDGDKSNPGEVVSTYGKEIAVYSYPAEQPFINFGEVATELGPTLASETTLDGTDALVIEANGAGQGNVGSVSFYSGDSFVVVYGYLSTEELETDAQNLVPLSTLSGGSDCGSASPSPTATASGTD